MENFINERKNAWNKKDVLANTAKQHTKEMQDMGSGVFGQDATEVAEIFKMYLKNKYERVFKKVIFAVPSGNGNYEAFVNTFANADKVLSSEAYAVVPVPGYREGNIY